ncbi:MAG: hypothetical protein GY753_07075, partial [Gammaproteobacteria bacterium]|nr:hypothetical protein [Gammaproteobacteria bacterium]
MSAEKGGQAQADKTQKSGAKSTAGTEPLFPVATLRGLNLNGSVNIGRLTTNGLLAEKVLFT